MYILKQDGRLFNILKVPVYHGEAEMCTQSDQSAYFGGEAYHVTQQLQG